MKVGDTRELVLFILQDQKLMALEDRRFINSHFRDPRAWFSAFILEGISSAEIKLVDQNTHGTYMFDCEVNLSGESCTVDVRQRWL